MRATLGNTATREFRSTPIVGLRLERVRVSGAAGTGAIRDFSPSARRKIVNNERRGGGGGR